MYGIVQLLHVSAYVCYCRAVIRKVLTYAIVGAVVRRVLTNAIVGLLYVRCLCMLL